MRYASDRARERRLVRAKARRAKLKTLGLCINGEPHGPATHGVLCERCRVIHSGIHSGIHSVSRVAS